MTAANGSSLRRRRLGHELRRLRERAGRTHMEIARHLDCSQTKISKIESGRVGVRTLELKVLLDLFEVPDDEAQPLLALARESRRRGVWQQYGDVWTSRFAGYAALEAEAVEIRSYESEVVPGLMQTPDYARAVNRATCWRASVDLDRETEARMYRQRRMREGEVELSAVVNEAAIRRVVGGVEVMRGQLRQLLELAGNPRVTLRVLPFSAGEHPAMTGPFVIARFTDPELDPDVVYLENQSGGLFLEDAAEARRYHRCFAELAGKSLDEAGTATLIGDLIEELAEG